MCKSLVFCRKWKRQRHIISQLTCEGCESKTDHDNCEKALKYSRNEAFILKKGIPEQYGIYYALGTALVAEGFLSACYHLCPSHASFQFDTTFMYVITILLFLKIYQFRHPDVTINAYKIIAFSCIFLLLEAVGYYISTIVFWIIFTSIYMGGLFIFSAETYFYGQLKVTFLQMLKALQLYKLYQIMRPKGISHLTTRQ